MDSNCGIYKIENKVNNKVYVGQSKDLKSRKRNHFNDLKRNQHTNFHLQGAFNKYEFDNFTFDILELCTEADLNDKEYKWMNVYKSHNSKFGYNITSPVNTNKHLDYSGVKYEDKNYNSYFMKDHSREELISCLQELYYMLGKVPVSRDLNKAELPSARVYYEVFGSFKNALIEADLYTLKESKSAFDRKEYTKDEIKDKFNVFIEKNNRYPNNIEMRNSRKYELPSYNTIIKKFGSIGNFRDELGYGKESVVEKQKQEALIVLLELYKTEGKLTARSIDKSRITRSASHYSRIFGSLKVAFKLINDIVDEKANKVKK